MKFKLLIILVALCITPLFPQGTGPISVLFSPSPTIRGLGNIGVGLPIEDPYAVYYNPANNFYRQEGIYFSQSEISSTVWLANSKFTYDTWNFGVIPQKVPIKFGINYHKTFYKRGELNNPYLNLDDHYEKTDAINLSIAYYTKISNIPINLSIGYTNRKVKVNTLSSLVRLTDTGELIYTKIVRKNNLYDIGLLFTLPYELFRPKRFYSQSIFKNFGLSIMPAFGYSIANIGDDINIGSNKHPTYLSAPRILRIGLSGTAIIKYKSVWNLLEWKWGRSASDFLGKEKNDTDDNREYQKGFADIDFFDNIIKSNTNPLIEIQRGSEWTILDFYSIRRGHTIHEGEEDDDDNRWKRSTSDIKMSGYGFKSEGVFKLLYFLLNNEVFLDLSNYIDIQYNHYKIESTRYWFSSLEQEIDAWTFTISNLDKISKSLFNIL